VSTFAWPLLLRIALRNLRLSPEDFWRLTPAELTVMLGNDSGNAPLGRNRLDELLQAFPDRIGDEEHE
jgi:uncharacterized phage protein (TIGR02216 family)